MIKRIFPDVADNNYQGSKLALYFLYPFALMTVTRSLIHMFMTDGGAQSIATIPLDSYSSGAADAVIHIFAEWGLTQLLFGLLYVVVLWRYRTLIPLIYLFIFVEYSVRFLLTQYKPMELEGTAPGGVVNYIFPAIALLMFALAIRKGKVNTNR